MSTDITRTNDVRAFDLNEEDAVTANTQRILKQFAPGYNASVVDALQSIVPMRDAIDPAEVSMHDARFTAWVLGMDFNDIAEAEPLQPASAAIAKSVRYRLIRMSPIERIQTYNERAISRAHLLSGDKYQSVLTELLNEKSWTARSKALTHFRKTVGMEGTSVTTVNVDNRKQTVNQRGAGGSFEQAMDRVRRQHREEDELLLPSSTVQEPTDDADVEDVLPL